MRLDKITKRAKKRQISRLKKAYHKLSKRHHCWVANMTLSAPMSEKELWIARIQILVQSMKTLNNFKEIPVVKPYEEQNAPLPELTRGGEQTLKPLKEE